MNPTNTNTETGFNLVAQNDCKPYPEADLNEMKAYIDAQQGGPSEGFFRLVSTPAEACQVITDGKMAILMGIEASELFDCYIRDHCSKETIEAQLLKVYNSGVRPL